MTIWNQRGRAMTEHPNKRVGIKTKQQWNQKWKKRKSQCEGNAAQSIQFSLLACIIDVNVVYSFSQCFTESKKLSLFLGPSVLIQ